jgi:CO/xanthine dehydrogenase Mo-binding subunit
MIKTTGTPSKSEGQVTFDDTGRVSIRCGTSDLGQGSHEALRRIVADALGVGLDRVGMEAFSTDMQLFDHMTASSRATFSMGSALSRACARLRDDLDSLTDRDLAVSVGSIGTDASDQAARWAAALRTAGRSHMSAVGVYESFGGAGKLDPVTGQGPNPSVHWHQGGAAVEVEVNLDTGKVAVVNCHGASYAGRVIHEQAAHAQNEGCMVLGIGTALYEQLVYDGGQLLNGSLDDYLMPTMPDLPQVIGSTLIESDDPDTEPHGIGEMVVPAVAPAIGNAIADALGVRLTSVPFTPEQVLRAWKESRS